MKKLTLSLLLPFILGSAGAQVASSSVGSDSRLSQANVSINAGSYGGPLSSLLAAVARSAGYEVLFDGNIDGSGAATPVVYNFANTPFNQVWPLLMDTYNLSYDVVRVGHKQVLRVGTNPIQKIIKLRNATADDIVNQVKLSFGTPQYTENPIRGADGQVVGTNRVLTDVKLDSPTLRIVSDPRSNSIIVRGTNREVSEVEQAIAQVDNGMQVSGDRSSRKIYSVLGNPAEIQRALRSQYPALQVSPVGQTQQLILNGDGKQLDAALAFLAEIDKPISSGPVIQQRVFQLVNASAKDIKDVLENTLQRNITPTTSSRPATPIVSVDTSGKPTVTVAPTTSAADNAASSAATAASDSNNAPAVTIIADQRTNTLVVRGTAQQVAQIAELIPQLDKAVPQINVQVRIQEISEEAGRTLGLKWNASLGGFNVNIGGSDGQSGLTGTFDPTRSLVNGWNILPTLQALESQTQSKRVYDGSISMQSGQRSSAASTGNASDSAAATIKSGGRLELNIPSVSGNITRSIDYGVVLDFTNPQVAPDGTITLDVHGQVNNLNTTINASTVPNILDFTNSEARTKISFKDGQTVLLSGLLGSNISNNTYGVPYLSSIPVLGKALSTNSTKNTQTQLLVVITANVLK